MKDNSTEKLGRETPQRQYQGVKYRISRKGKMPVTGIRKTRGEASLGTWKEGVECEADQSPSNSKPSKMSWTHKTKAQQKYIDISTSISLNLSL